MKESKEFSKKENRQKEEIILSQIDSGEEKLEPCEEKESHNKKNDVNYDASKKNSRFHKFISYLVAFVDLLDNPDNEVY